MTENKTDCKFCCPCKYNGSKLHMNCLTLANVWYTCQSRSGMTF